MQMTYGHGQKQRKNTGKQKQNSRAGRQLAQLLLSLAVFLAVFIGKGVWPSEVARTGEQLLHVIQTNTDFRAAFAQLGQALAGPDSVLGEIGEFCVSVFAPAQQMGPDLSVGSTQSELSVTPTDDTKANQLTAVHLGAEIDTESLSAGPAAQPEPEPTLQVGELVQVTQNTDQVLPEGYSAQWLYLGDMQTATPVSGEITSPFGYRYHPTIGRHAVHGGVDIAADRGTAVTAFADGVVAFVGENDDFGLYLQLDHANGVSTFYSHCHRINVRKGAQVTAGQTVAQVGSTGNSTGPHLHFEVRLNGVRLDPMYYIDPEQGA